MAEKSIFWTTGATGDGASAYTQDEVIRWMRQDWIADNTLEGVLKGYENELEVTGVATPVSVNTGAAIIYGFPYWNTSTTTVAIPTPSSNTRIDVIVLRANWTAQTVRITRIAGTEGAGAPSITQSAGATWDIKIAEASITTGGVITVTDYRVFVHPNIAVDENMIDASVAGPGLIGGDGSALEVNDDNATLEISSDVLRVKDAGIDENKIVSTALANGLKGGSGTTLAVEPTDIAGDGLRDDGGTPDKLAVDVSDFAGTGLEDDGSENLRIAAAAAGDGLTGGGGSALATDPDGTTLENSGGKIQVKDDGVNDDKIGDRVVGLPERRGGGATNWHTPGTTDYVPNDVRMCCGAHTVTVLDGNVSHSETITFPFAFSAIPIVLVTAQDSAFATSSQIPIAGISQNQVTTTNFVVAVTRRDPATTTGTQDVIVHWAAFGAE